ncbi:hypothetical protein TNCV_3416881 [Trichonephila clavipes]|nr:hypothetical protein TNCV_3416881 [Trichonephila clavipes]
MCQKQGHQNVNAGFAKSKEEMGFRTIRTGASKFHDNDTNASGHASSNYEKECKVNTCTLNSSELNAATERKLSSVTHFSRTFGK